MPTPDGRRSVQDALDEGLPLVEASGLKGMVWHKLGCRGNLYGRQNTCDCRLDSRIRAIAHQMADLMQDYPEPKRGEKQ